MRGLATGCILAVVLVAGAVAPAAAAPGRSEVHGSPVLLALGDSVPAGQGAVPPPGYPERLGALLENGYDPAADKADPDGSVDFDVVNLAVRGATTATLIRDQLPAAIQLIRERRSDRDPYNDVEVVTVTIGGNDVFQPVVAACLSAPSTVACQPTVDFVLAATGTGVTAILGQVTAAAGRRTEVVVTTYYNPIGSCALSAHPAAVPVADAVLEGGTVPGLVSVADGLNDRIRRAAAATGAQVAELYGALDPADLVGGLDCLHPDASGHQRIAEEAYDTLAR